jgi:toxin ParE1/3/4
VKPLVFNAQATAEFDDSAKWYETQRPGLAREFRAEVEDALGRIHANPRQFPLHSRPGFRMCFVRRFPYTIFFAEQDQFIWIAAIAHQRRRPGYWSLRKIP